MRSPNVPVQCSVGGQSRLIPPFWGSTRWESPNSSRIGPRFPAPTDTKPSHRQCRNFSWAAPDNHRRRDLDSVAAAPVGYALSKCCTATAARSTRPSSPAPAVNCNPSGRPVEIGIARQSPRPTRACLNRVDPSRRDTLTRSGGRTRFRPCADRPAPDKREKVIGGVITRRVSLRQRLPGRRIRA